MRAPASTATSALATPQPASSWVWMPTWTPPSSATTAAVAGGHLAGQRRAVRVAERHVLGAGLGGRPQAAQRVGGVVAVGVEEVLGVVDHALALGHEECHRVGDHPQVLLRVHLASPSRGGATRSCRPACRPARSDSASRRSAGSSAAAHVPPAGHPEGRDLGVLEALAREQLEELLLLRVRGRGSRPRSGARRASRARGRRAASRRPRATCPRPACRHAGWCRRPGPSVSCGERLSVYGNERTERPGWAAYLIRSPRVAFTPAMVPARGPASPRSAGRGRGGRRRRRAGPRG